MSTSPLLRDSNAGENNPACRVIKLLTAMVVMELLPMLPIFKGVGRNAAEAESLKLTLCDHEVNFSSVTNATSNRVLDNSHI